MHLILKGMIFIFLFNKNLLYLSHNRKNKLTKNVGMKDQINTKLYLNK